MRRTGTEWNFMKQLIVFALLAAGGLLAAKPLHWQAGKLLDTTRLIAALREESRDLVYRVNQAGSILRVG